MHIRPLPSLELVRRVFVYEPEQGSFHWRECRSRRPRHSRGEIAGCLSGYGYWLLSINGRQYPAHRIAWLYYYGREPVYQIDHRNLCRSDNRIANLREASHAENNINKGPNKNNRHGTKGVSPQKGRWIAQIKKNYVNHFLGSFDTPEEAHRAYLAKAKELFGEFARGG
jgi:hypothetical protein